MSSIIAHRSFVIFSLAFATRALFFHSFSIASRSTAVTLQDQYMRTCTVSLESELTFFAFPFLSPSSLVSISTLSVSRVCTLAMRFAVLSVEFRWDSELRRFFAVLTRAVVCVRRSRMLSSRAASCSFVHASAAFWRLGQTQTDGSTKETRMELTCRAW
jgi:hypothetical protein